MYILPTYNGAAIREARQRRGWTIRRVAELADVADSTVHRLERTGRSRVSNVKNILDVLGVHIEDVLITRGEHTAVASERVAERREA